MNRFLSKDFLSGLMFIAFGLVALYFGWHLAVGTSVRMGRATCPACCRTSCWAWAG